jgi:hypothetical protein
MSTATLTSLLDYLYGTLTTDNMRWVGEHLIEHANQQEEHRLKPYTMDEINAMLDEAELNIASGNTIPSEDVWLELENEFAHSDARYAASYVSES